MPIIRRVVAEQVLILIWPLETGVKMSIKPDGNQ